MTHFDYFRISSVDICKYLSPDALSISLSSAPFTRIHILHQTVYITVCHIFHIHHSTCVVRRIQARFVTFLHTHSVASCVKVAAIRVKCCTLDDLFFKLCLWLVVAGSKTLDRESRKDCYLKVISSVHILGYVASLFRVIVIFGWKNMNNHWCQLARETLWVLNH